MSTYPLSYVKRIKERNTNKVLWTQIRTIHLNSRVRVRGSSREQVDLVLDLEGRGGVGGGRRALPAEGELRGTGKRGDAASLCSGRQSACARGMEASKRYAKHFGFNL